MLSDKYNYVFLDFETTGLDLASDFPLQIALIQTDHNLKIIKQYGQYISLPESIKKLRSNVSYMTGINIETIEEYGQPLETIQLEIKGFFWPDTILIGQNISFDIGFLRKFFPWCEIADNIDIYPLAISTIPYLKSYSLESVDHHLANKYESYRDQKTYLLKLLHPEEMLSAHHALYDCIVGICFISRWCDQLKEFTIQFPIIQEILMKTDWEWVIKILSLWKEEKLNQSRIPYLPILSSPIAIEKKNNHQTVIDRTQATQHSKRSSKWIDLKSLIAELPHPCIIAVSHGSKIDIIKKACERESFDYLKEEQVIDQERLSLWLKKASYTVEEFLFIVFYLSHYRDGYRVLQATLNKHRYILDYLHVKNNRPKKDKKALCTHGWLYYTIENNPEWKELYKEYPICILDADRRHTTYNDYAQKGLNLSSLLYQREKFHYIYNQEIEKDIAITREIEEIINSLTFFIAHFGSESELKYRQLKQYKRETNYIINDISYNSSMSSWLSLWELWIKLSEKKIIIPVWLNDLMKKTQVFFENPLKIQRMTNQNKDIWYTISPSVRYIDFAEYLKMFGDHKTFFFSPARAEYKRFIEGNKKKSITVTYEDNIEKILELTQNIPWSIFIISHNSEKSKKIFTLLHDNNKQTHTLIGEHLTGWVAKNAIKQSNDKPSIIIWGYHMLLHFWGEWNHIDHVIITYIHQWMKSFIQDDIEQYAMK